MRMPDLLSVLKRLSMRTSPRAYPMPIIVGSPRSGTTLLRLMLDAHPDLTIPPETGFLVMRPEPSRAEETEAAAFARCLTSYPPDAPGWADFQLPSDEFARRVGKLAPFSPAEGFREFYRMYAERIGKPRWGDKTPMYSRHLREIEALLPEARFIHLIRDGRDTAVSLRRQWFSPGSDIATQARFWRDNVRNTRREGAACRHYLEVHYEDLVRDPSTVLKRICTSIELRWDERVLAYHHGAATRLAEHQGRRRSDGSLLLTSEARRQQQASSAELPNSAKIGQWRQALTPEEQQSFADEAGALLIELGYPMG
jgi:hypothetical protein